jgi:uncharacterized membrane protein YphA (DoxX/SURF4 family)
VRKVKAIVLYTPSRVTFLIDILVCFASYIIFFCQMKNIRSNRQRTWNIIILLIRIWLGFRMFTASYSSVVGILFHPEERAFFRKWFGDQLHFPIPLYMAFLAKGAELTGAVLVFIGLFTRASASLIAFTMLIATLTANLGQDFNIDGGFTISYFLFAVILIHEGGGRYAVDTLFRFQALRRICRGRFHRLYTYGKYRDD